MTSGAPAKPVVRVIAALRRFVAAIEPWYDWGRIYVSRLDTTQPNGDGINDGEVRYFELQWFGAHLAFHIGRVPRKGNHGGEAPPTHPGGHQGDAGGGRPGGGEERSTDIGRALPFERKEA